MLDSTSSITLQARSPSPYSTPSLGTKRSSNPGSTTRVGLGFGGMSIGRPPVSTSSSVRERLTGLWYSDQSTKPRSKPMLSFPGEVREATERRAPHRIAGYALELGQAFAAFYRDSPVLKEPDATLQAFRIALCVTSQRTLAAALGLLGVSAPEAM